VTINPAELARTGGKVFFVCDESVYGEELWVYEPIFRSEQQQS
jgi:hypothetical protein